MNFLRWLFQLLTANHNRTEVPGAPPPLNEFEKAYVQRVQTEMAHTLESLEIQVKVETRK